MDCWVDAGTLALPATIGSRTENTPPQRESQLITQVFCQVEPGLVMMLAR